MEFCAKVCKSIPKYTIVFQSMHNSARIWNFMFKLSKVKSRSLGKYAKVCKQNIQKHEKNLSMKRKKYIQNYTKFAKVCQNM